MAYNWSFTKNKVKYIAPFVSLIHSVDSLDLLMKINAEALKNERIIDCLFQIKIAQEDSKYGLSQTALEALIQSEALAKLENIRILGLMGMGSFVSDESITIKEFQTLKKQFDKIKQMNTLTDQFNTISMGMSGDYQLAIAEGSNMVRIGSYSLALASVSLTGLQLHDFLSYFF